MMISLIKLLVVGIVLVGVQLGAAWPWLWVLNVDLPRGRSRRQRLGNGLILWIGGGVVAGLVMGLLIRNPNRLLFWGGVYGAVLHIQLAIDFFVLTLALLLRGWPKGGAVAFASFREGLRHPMFWFLIILAMVLLTIMPILPYFTFGEDFKMVKDLGYSTIMLVAGAFGILAASMLISEEIEGRTAITLMSKPISRRQFLLGKFAGLLLAALAMTALLSWVFDGLLLFKWWYDKETIPFPDWLIKASPAWQSVLGEMSCAVLQGTGWWFDHVVNMLPGVVLGFCEVMVLLAIAVALATRLPMILNVTVCLVVFVLGNLIPVLVQSTQNSYAMVRFTAQLFDTLLPALEFFNLGPAIARETPLPGGEFSIYIGWVVLYAVLYTTIALLLGLILFEDRDLA